jgi:CelD/BcsL family acetyltransferase involved in cellulose biosynthesis
LTSDYQIHDFTSVEQLRSAADRWNDLWQLGDATSPLFRAEPLAQWIEQFAPTKTPRAVLVTQGNRPLAALPLTEIRVGRIVKAAGMTANAWSPCGDLLLDARCDARAALAALVAYLGDLDWPLLWLDAVPIQTDRWRQFIAACDDVGFSIDCHENCQVGRIPIGGSWEDYRRSWSKNHRKSMRKNVDRLRKLGRLDFERHANLAAAAVEPLLLSGFEVEHKNWKGEQESSVLASPGMFEYYLGQARRLAEARHLELHFLRLDGRPIAFEYGFRGKGVYHSFKVGYDAEFARYSPGQVLMHEQLRAFHASGDVISVDCMGAVSDAVNRWKPNRYPLARLVVAPSRLLSRTLMTLYKYGWRRLRNRSRQGAMDVAPLSA